jgi:hypothetical protein
MANGLKSWKDNSLHSLRDLPSMSLQIGYCTNVHAGPTLEQTRANLTRYALAVKQTVRPNDSMGVGLWLAAPAVQELLSTGQAAEFADWLASVGLIPFTFNGFPYGDFHGPVVKHRVYEPTWWEPERLSFTLQLIEAQHRLLPAGLEGTISTLPIAWSQPHPTHAQLTLAAQNLRTAAVAMQRLKAETGRVISLCLEPEPGCYLQRSDDMVHFFQEWLFREGDEAVVREHLRICHDVCHAAVMFEPQTEVLQKYAAAGIQVGKVQVSAAVAARFNELAPAERQAAFKQLSAFHEPRYLHQTCIQQAGEAAVYYEDLPQALATVAEHASPTGEWRMHFHVPIYLSAFGALHATQPEILECLRVLQATSSCQHYEVETYAWGVLPKELQVSDLAIGIAHEMDWFYRQLT